MGFLGRRIPYVIALCLFATANATLMSMLNDGYDVAKADSGVEAAFAFAMVGLCAAALGLMMMVVMLALRLRNADRSAWWALLGLIPFLNFIVLFGAIFLPEEY